VGPKEQWLGAIGADPSAEHVSQPSSSTNHPLGRAEIQRVIGEAELRRSRIGTRAGLGFSLRSSSLKDVWVERHPLRPMPWAAARVRR
jgi:hypothetical protein